MISNTILNIFLISCIIFMVGVSLSLLPRQGSLWDQSSSQSLYPPLLLANTSRSREQGSFSSLDPLSLGWATLYLDSSAFIFCFVCCYPNHHSCCRLCCCSFSLHTCCDPNEQGKPRKGHSWCRDILCSWNHVWANNWRVSF